MPKPKKISFKQPSMLVLYMSFSCKCLMGIAIVGMTGCQQLQVFNQSQYKNQDQNQSSNATQPLYEEDIQSNKTAENLYELPPEVTTSAQASDNVNIFAEQIHSEAIDVDDPIQQAQQQISDAENDFIEFIDQKKQIELVDCPILK